jgi:hypothetical protein
MGIFGIAKKGFGLLGKTQATQRIAGAIKSVKPTLTKGESTKVWGKKLRGKFKKDLGKSTEGIDKVLTDTNKLVQKVKGEKITKSGFSKAKDIK